MGFPTEQETYHRLRWDPRFDVRRCTIVVARRTREGDEQHVRVPFLEHDTDVVPWHRIVEFWIDDELAWSRPRRIDRLDALAGEVTAIETPAGPHPHLRVVTWNLLFDRYDAERLRSAERWQHALDLLAALGADVIALAEVTPALGRLIRAQPWTAAYACAGFDDLVPYGQVLLSRRGLANVRRVELAGGKRAVLATVEGIDVAAVHLTSNRKVDAAARRAEQLATVLAALGPRCVIAGDFNSPPDELALPEGTVDAWRAVHGALVIGATFDVERNPLAATGSRTGKSVRMDRVHARGVGPVIACALVGEEAGACGLHPSDHFGVVADFDTASDIDLARVALAKSVALAIVPPAWGAIQEVRCRDDRNWRRWPPHVTLFHPFVGEAWIARACEAIAPVLAATAPFALELDRVGTLDERRQLVVLEPSARSARALVALHAALVATLPAQLAPARPYRPHLTLGRTGRTELGGSDPRTTFVVERLVVLAERDGMFRELRSLPLGDVAPPPAPPLEDLAPRFARVLDRVRAALPGARVEPFGSAIYAPAHAADLDLIVVGDADLASLGLAPTGRGHYRGAIDDLAVDVLRVEAAAERDLAAIADARALRDHLRAHGRDAAFLAAWPDVRRFAHARGLTRNGLGYFGSFGWAMLLAVPLCHDPALCRVPPGDAFAAWLRWLPSLRPHAHVGFDRISHADPATLYIAAPSPPSRNVARHLTAATARTLLAELARPTLVDLADAPPPGVTIAVPLAPAERGPYEGAMRGLLLDLERILGAPPRVWGRFERSSHHHITVAPADEALARATIDAFVARLHAPR